MSKIPVNRYPENKAKTTKVWCREQLVFSILWHSEARHYCGYVRFPKRPLRELKGGGIATYVPVHGGFTYAEEDDDGRFVYGFDCGHLDDEKNPELKSIEWLTAECERMARGIRMARWFELLYLATRTLKMRAKLIDFMHKVMRWRGLYFKHHFISQLNLLFGHL